MKIFRKPWLIITVITVLVLGVSAVIITTAFSPSESEAPSKTTTPKIAQQADKVEKPLVSADKLYAAALVQKESDSSAEDKYMIMTLCCKKNISGG